MIDTSEIRTLENGIHGHTVDEDFQHFMTYSGHWEDSEETIALLKEAYTAAWESAEEVMAHITRVISLFAEERKSTLKEIGMCPFCRKPTVLAVYNPQGKDSFVECSGCKTQGPSGKSEEEAIELWNVASN